MLYIWGKNVAFTSSCSHEETKSKSGATKNRNEKLFITEPNPLWKLVVTDNLEHSGAFNTDRLSSSEEKQCKTTAYVSEDICMDDVFFSWDRLFICSGFISSTAEYNTMEEKHRSILRKCKADLVKDMSLAGQLMARLEAKGTFSKIMLENIKSSGNQYDQKGRILDELPGRRPCDFKLFCEALAEDEQGHLVEKYLQEGLDMDEKLEDLNPKKNPQGQSASKECVGITFEEMNTVAGLIGNDWKKLAHQLFSSDQDTLETRAQVIDNLESSNKSLYDKCFDMLDKWKMRCTNPTKQRLIEALKAIHKTNIVKRLENVKP